MTTPHTAPFTIREPNLLRDLPGNRKITITVPNQHSPGVPSSTDLVQGSLLALLRAHSFGHTITGWANHGWLPDDYPEHIVIPATDLFVPKVPDPERYVHQIWKYDDNKAACLAAQAACLNPNLVHQVVTARSTFEPAPKD